jgi:hypothetical protein
MVIGAMMLMLLYICGSDLMNGGTRIAADTRLAHFQFNALTTANKALLSKLRMWLD